MLQPRLCTRHAQRLCHPIYSPYHHRAYATAVVSTTSTIVEPPPTKDEEPGTSQLVRKYKPRTPGLRHLRRPINDHLWKGRAHLPLTYPRKGHGIGGRNNSGKVVLRHRGGGHKRRIRIVDFHRLRSGVQVVERIEHDPGRSAHIALLTHKETQTKSYIVASEGMRAGDVVESYRKGFPPRLLSSMGGVRDMGMLAAKTAWRGNCLPLFMIPVGTSIYNIGLRPGQGGKLCRGAGTYAQIVGTSDDEEKQIVGRHVLVRLPSGETRKLPKDACATIGIASNPNYNRRQLGKAGRSRWLGIRPTVRGLAMNAFEHAHGGGRGKSKGNVHPVSIWGTPAKGGFKTRKKSNVNKAVVIPRPRNQGRRKRDQGGGKRAAASAKQ